MSLTQDERDWLRRIEDKIDKFLREGCSKSPQHVDHELRIRTVEKDQAEARGRRYAEQGIISVIVSVACVFINRLFK